MKIKNVSAKVIGVLGRDLMPDQSMTCNKAMVENLAVATMLKMGFLQLDDSAEKEAAMKEAMRQQILKEQAEEKEKAEAEAAALAQAEAAAATAEDAPEAPKAPKKANRAPKPAETAAE